MFVPNLFILVESVMKVDDMRTESIIAYQMPFEKGEKKPIHMYFLLP
jgi:hypothetical protein